MCSVGKVLAFVFQLRGADAEGFDAPENKTNGRICWKRRFDGCIMSYCDYVAVVEEVHEGPFRHGPSDIPSHTGKSAGWVWVFR